MDDDHDIPPDEARSFRLAALILVTVVVVLALCGCASESRERQDMIIVGTLNGEPVRLEIQGQSATITKSGPGIEQIEAATRKIVAAGMSEIASKIPGAAAIEAIVKATIGPAKPDPFPWTETGLLATAVGWGTREMLNGRAQKRDADEAWDHIKKQAAQGVA